MSSNKKWTEEVTRKEAEKYTTFKEFIKYSNSAYISALKNGWLKDYYWLKRKFKEPGYWTFEKCYEAALQCKTRTEFSKRYPTAYTKSCKNKWIEEFNWLKNERFNIETDKIDCVYVYEFATQKTAYVGRTLIRRKQNRDKEHIFEKNDPVAKFAYENNISVPNPIYLEENLTIEESVEKECWWIEKYREDGWKMLNKMPGGGIGGLLKEKWTYEKVKEEALKYSTITEFRKSGGYACDKAYIFGWIKDFTWLKQTRKQPGYWNYETCYEEAKKYKNRYEFQEKCSGAFKQANKNGWLKDYDWFTYNKKHTSGYWTKERCYEEAKKYKGKYEFQQGNASAYYASHKNGWFEEYTWFVNPSIKWTFDTCYEEAKKYTSRLEFSEKNNSAYRVALDNGWLEYYTWMLSKKRREYGYWNYETCYEEAKKYGSRKELNDNCASAYNVALKNGWLDDYTWFKTPEKIIKLTYEVCFEIAKKCADLKELSKYHTSAYNKARKKGWLKDYTWLKRERKIKEKVENK